MLPLALQSAAAVPAAMMTRMPAWWGLRTPCPAPGCLMSTAMVVMSSSLVGIFSSFITLTRSSACPLITPPLMFVGVACRQETSAELSALVTRLLGNIPTAPSRSGVHAESARGTITTGSLKVLL